MKQWATLQRRRERGLTLLEVPEDVYARPAGKIDRAIAFVRAHTQPSGALGTADRDIPDYPNYATALAVSATNIGTHASAVRFIRRSLANRRARCHAG